MRQRYFIKLSYNGQGFYGWQVQPKNRSVQSEIQNALSLLLKNPTEIFGAGRTDAGVHALQMYAHFDSETPIADLPQLIYRLNKFLHRNIVVHKIYLVRKDAHARFDAISRTYQYKIHIGKSAFFHQSHWLLDAIPNGDAMKHASAWLIGNKEFSGFEKSNTNTKSDWCNVTKAIWRHCDDEWIFEITANRFLRNMVRSIVGTLVDIGRNKRKSEDICLILKQKSRSLAGVSAPAHGLYLSQIIYSPSIEL